MFLYPNSHLFSQEKWDEREVIVKIKPNKDGSKKSLRNANIQKRFQQVGLVNAKQLYTENATYKRSAKFRLNDIYKVSIKKEKDISQVIEVLNQEEWVEYAEPNYIYQPLGGPPNDEYADRHWGHEKAKVYDAWDFTMGSPEVIIGLVDQGFTLNHPDLKNQFYINQVEQNGETGVDDDHNGFIDDIIGYDFGDGDANVEVGNFQHGMQVAGIAGAEANNKIGVFGVAPKSKLMALKVGRNSTGAYVNTFEAVKYAADNGCKVINLSWGRQGFPSKYEEEIIDYCVKEKNVVFVAAAGNTASHGAYYPASYENVLSVTYSNEADQRDGNSTNNYFVDITAPGVAIPTTQGASGYQLSITGSSYATPFAAGAAALLYAQYPELTGKQIAELLRVTSDDIYSIGANSGKIDQLGKGRINVLKAMTQKDSTAAIRVTNYRLETSQGSRLIPGDKVTIKAQVTNYLAPASELSVTLSSPSSLVAMQSSEATVGTLNTLEQSGELSFEFELSAEATVNSTIPLRFGFSDDTYSDFHYINLFVRPVPQVFKLNRIALGADTDGRIGVTGTPDDPRGPGFYYDGGSDPLGNPTRAGISLMNSSGLIIASSAEQVSDAVQGSTATSLNNDFTATQTIGLNGMHLYEYEGNALSFKGEFEDNSTNDNPIGLEITQTITGYQTTDDLNYVINQYDMTNVSGVDIRKLYFTLFADWNLPLEDPEKAGWSEEHKMGYVYQDSSHYVGVKVLNQKPIHQAINLSTPTTQNPILSDGFTDAEKHTAISQGVVNTEAGEGDLAHIVGADISPLFNGSTETVVLVMMYASTLDELFATAERSEVFTDEIPVDVITSLAEDDLKTSFSIWPNPAQSHFSIQFEEALTQPGEITLVQLDGKQVKQWALQKGVAGFRKQLPELASGLYLLKVQVEGKEVAKKLYVR